MKEIYNYFLIYDTLIQIYRLYNKIVNDITTYVHIYLYRYPS